MNRGPAIRVLGGLFFILAGFLAYFGVRLGTPLPIIFVIAGAGLILFTMIGRGARGSDLAIFTVGLIVLGAVMSSPAFPSGQRLIYSATKTQLSVQQIDLTVTASFGSITIQYSDQDDLVYQIDFSGSSGYLLPFPGPQHELSNRTRNGVLSLNASPSASSITVTLGRGYLVNIDASASTGSITMASARTEALGRVSLSTGTGSIDATLTVASISNLKAETGTGSIDLRSDHLLPKGTKASITVSTGTGSVDLNFKIPRNTAISVTASTALGGVDSNLPEFSITQRSGTHIQAAAGDIAAAELSFILDVSAGAGSIDLSLQRTDV